jgi:hypothetical protein
MLVTPRCCTAPAALQAPSQGLRKHGRSVLLRQIGFALHNSNQHDPGSTSSCDSSVAAVSCKVSAVHDAAMHSASTEHTQRKSSGALTPAKRVRLSSLNRDDSAHYSTISNSSGTTAAAATDAATGVHRHSTVGR